MDTNQKKSKRGSFSINIIKYLYIFEHGRKARLEKGEEIAEAEGFCPEEILTKDNCIFFYKQIFRRKSFGDHLLYFFYMGVGRGFAGQSQ